MQYWGFKHTCQPGQIKNSKDLETKVRGRGAVPRIIYQSYKDLVSCVLVTLEEPSVGFRYIEERMWMPLLVHVVFTVHILMILVVFNCFGVFICEQNMT